MFTKYRVIFTTYAREHFLSELERSHPEVWPATRRAITSQLHNVDMLIGTGRTEPPIYLSADRRQKLLSLSFALAGSNISPSQSGYRLVAQIDDTEKLVQILFIYHDSHLPSNVDELTWRQQILKEQYQISLK